MDIQRDGQTDNIRVSFFKQVLGIFYRGVCEALLCLCTHPEHRVTTYPKPIKSSWYILFTVIRKMCIF